MGIGRKSLNSVFLAQLVAYVRTLVVSIFVSSVLLAMYGRLSTDIQHIQSYIDP